MTNKNTHDRLLWLDLETTGLHPETCEVLEIAAVLTDGDFVPIMSAEGVIRYPERFVKHADPYVVTMHTKSGLWDECEKSTCSVEEAEATVLNLITPWIAKAKPILAGSSVHFDRAFLRRHMPALDRALHYRHFDVSVLHRAAELWAPEAVMKKAEPVHRAMADVKHSMNVAKYYRRALAGLRPREGAGT